MEEFDKVRILESYDLKEIQGLADCLVSRKLRTNPRSLQNQILKRSSSQSLEKLEAQNIYPDSP